MIEDLLARLDSVTVILDQTASSDLDAIAPALARRNEAIAELEARLHNQRVALSQAELDRLRAVAESGERLAAKLLIAKAALRDQLTHLFHSRFLLHALAPPFIESPQIDCRG